MIAAGLFVAQIVPLSLLDRTEVSKYKQKHSPFSRQVEVPPEYLANYLIGSLFGGAKQIAVNVFWVNYRRLTQQEEFEEAIAVLEALRVLQPHRERVWEFLTWDIAYNLSKRQPTLEKEWMTVKRGIGVAKEGVRRMPNSYGMCQYAARVYGRRIRQHPHLMDQVWKETGESDTDFHVSPFLEEDKAASLKRHTFYTNYRIAVEYLKMGRRRAQKRDELDQYKKWYGFLVKDGFYDILKLAQYDQHQRALDRIDPVRKLVGQLILDFDKDKEYIPEPYRVRYRSFQDLPRLIKLDRKLSRIPWSTEEERRKNREKMVDMTRRYLKAWSEFFQQYNNALAEEAARLILRRSLVLLKYVANDIERYYKTGDESYRRRGRKLLQETLLPLIEGLIPSKGNPGGGYLVLARRNLGTYWETMNNYFDSLKSYETAEDPQKREDAARKLEDVYTELFTLYTNRHTGFHRSWFNSYRKRLEKALQIQ